ncbi:MULTISPECIES: hypothetical protein [Streptomyces]|uniref:Uncharacterized protein n=1 Tax=Streptomyces lasiicapitis TaxID=1923961 RepID=A0ABQ2MBS0_9ACTN|nr:MULTISPECIES: hypothetical protein [Streptomyces]QIB41924.1 hypothetical protein G3H79_01395 [Streptomyces aureoverticillatus]GGO49271.1 hypothetical protein GCM10012286_46840 [Streptomyces lasiicapitis]
MRYVIEVYRSHDGVCGSVASESCASPRPFHGWLELLSLLEPPQPDGAAQDVPPLREPPGAGRAAP